MPDSPSLTLSISGFPQLLCASHGTLVIYEVLPHVQLKVGVLWSIILNAGLRKWTQILITELLMCLWAQQLYEKALCFPDTLALESVQS